MARRQFFAVTRLHALFRAHRGLGRRVHNRAGCGVLPVQAESGRSLFDASSSDVKTAWTTRTAAKRALPRARTPAERSLRLFEPDSTTPYPPANARGAEVDPPIARTNGRDVIRPIRPPCGSADGSRSDPSGHGDRANEPPSLLTFRESRTFSITATEEDETAGIGSVPIPLKILVTIGASSA